MSQESCLHNQQLRSDAPGAPGAQPSMANMALEFIKDGDVVGLGTGRAATAFVRALGDAVKAGLGSQRSRRRRSLPRWQHSSEYTWQP